MELSMEDKKELLRIARSSIQAEIDRSSESMVEPSNAALKIPSGTFVTLRLHQDLRGCIGFIEARFPLWQAIEEVAKKAAFEDPRFFPVTAEELELIEIEISILSPLKIISDVAEIEVGKHGLVIDAGYARGLLLPQVATEFGWNGEQFLSHAAQKAGLPFDAWKSPGIQLFTFTADVFSEAEFEELHH